MRVLHALCFSTLFVALQSHASVIIHVNTFVDENGENASQCSLREAIQAVNTLQKFGGCEAGDRYLTNIIQLQNGTYTLSKELLVSHPVTIQGVNTSVKTEIDSIFRIKPKRQPPTLTLGSKIDGNFQSRIFNSAASKSSITLNNIFLLNGKADVGGAVLVGGQLSLDNSIISNNTASIAGGAIYLEGRDARVSSIDSTWSKNTSPNGKGAVMAMSCTDDLKPIPRSLDIIRSSIIENGSLTDKSIIDGCSSVSLKIDVSTIAKNTAKSLGGILYFAEQMASGSSLELLHTTVVENNGAPAINYNLLSSLAVNSSVVAFNNGLGCPAVPKNPGATTYTGSHNAYQNCLLADSDRDKDEGDKLDKHPEVILTDELTPLGNYGGYTLSYLPTASAHFLANAGLSTSPDCTEYFDQRNSSSTNICNIGSTAKRLAMTISDNMQVISNKDNTDRIAEIDALANDIPSETDQTDDIANARGDFAKDAAGNYDDTAIAITAGSEKCQVVKPVKTGARPLIRFDNHGEVMAPEQTFTCKYKFTDNNGKVSTEGELFFRTENKPPVAGDDTYTLPSGETRILLDLLSNDSDKNDGKYGGLCTTNDVRCNDGRYIRIAVQPELGVIEADKEGSCPDSNELNKYTCFGGNIYYRAKNSLAPFDDKFSYVVYDIDKAPSNAAAVTIINQTAENEKNNSGAFGLISLFGLAGLAFYRRFRK